jgi:hypothetical protein
MFLTALRFNPTAVANAKLMLTGDNNNGDGAEMGSPLAKKSRTSSVEPRCRPRSKLRLYEGDQTPSPKDIGNLTTSRRVL